jgi:AraC family transcriptional regulator of adaptative response/methylated-DNA-[protein]-cysteine methyltransferase
MSGAEEQIRYGTGLSSIGSILVGVSGQAVVAILIGENPEPDQLVHELQRRHPEAGLVRDDHGCRDYVAQVLAFIETPTRDLELPVQIRGTPFQRRVWHAVRAIPFGQTSSFTAVARKIGAPKAVRAIGNACSNNPLELAIPCHRVLRSDGSVSGGSAWGDRRQRTLITREADAIGEKS